MTFILIVIGLSVFCVVLFQRELLVQRRSFKIILICCLVLFATGLLLHLTKFGRSIPSGALLAPLLCLAFYRTLRRIFVRYVGREPRDTYMDWTPGLAVHRLFNIVFFMGAFWIVIGLMALMDSLATAGW